MPGAGLPAVSLTRTPQDPSGAGSCLPPAPGPSSSPTGWTGCQQKSRSRGAKFAVTNPQGLKHAACCRGKPEAGSFEARRGLWFPGREPEPFKVQRQSWWYMWAGSRRSPAPNFLDTSGGFPFPPHKSFHLSPSFSAAFPTLLLLAGFIVLWGSISAMAGNARAQLGPQGSGMGRGKNRQGERRPSLAQKSQVSRGEHTTTPEEAWVPAQPLLWCAVPQDKSLTPAGAPFDHLHIEKVITVACLLS